MKRKFSIELLLWYSIFLFMAGVFVFVIASEYFAGMPPLIDTDPALFIVMFMGLMLVLVLAKLTAIEDRLNRNETKEKT